MKKIKRRSVLKNKEKDSLCTNNMIDKNQGIYTSLCNPDEYTPEAVKKAQGWFLHTYDIRLRRLKAIASERKTLDIGCGSGSYLIPLLESGFDVYGIDYSKPFVEKSNSLIRSIKEVNSDIDRVIYGNACNMPYDDESFDFIYSISTIPYIQQKKKLMEEVKRVLRPGGLAYLEFGNKKAMAHRKAIKSHLGLKNYDIDVAEILDLVRSADFNINAVRVNQVFPMYVSKSDGEFDTYVSIRLRELMGKVAGVDVTIDEASSSSAVTCDYGYKVTVILSKPIGKYIDDLFVPISKFGNPTKWLSQGISFDFSNVTPDTIERRIMSFYKCLIADTTDCFAIYGLMRLHGKEYDDIAEKYLEDIRRFYGDNLDPGRKIFQVNEVGNNSDVKISEKNPKISIVLPVYNGMPYLQKQLESLYQQTIDNIEIIIVNDGSTDGTKEFLDNFKPVEKHRLKIIHQENRKLPAALNRGFSESTGEKLSWVSSDCVCRNDMFEVLLNALELHSDIGMSYSSFFFIDDNDKIIGKVEYQPLTYRDLLIRNHGNAAFLYTRKAMERVGIYDERFVGAEDWHYWLRMSTMFPFIYVNTPLYYYRLHSTSMQSTMSPEISDTAEKMIAEFVKTSGDRLDLGKLYPSILKEIGSVEKKKLITEAQADFMARLLTARTSFMVNISSVFMEELLRSNLNGLVGLQVFAHYVVMLVMQQKQDEAVEFALKAISMVNDVNISGNKNAERYLSSMKQFVETKDPNVISKLTPIWLSKNPLLFKHDRMYIYNG